MQPQVVQPSQTVVVELLDKDGNRVTTMSFGVEPTVAETIVAARIMEPGEE